MDAVDDVIALSRCACDGDRRALRAPIEIARGATNIGTRLLGSEGRIKWIVIGNSYRIQPPYNPEIDRSRLVKPNSDEGDGTFVPAFRLQDRKLAKLLIGLMEIQGLEHDFVGCRFHQSSPRTI